MICKKCGEDKNPNRFQKYLNGKYNRWCKACSSRIKPETFEQSYKDILDRIEREMVGEES